VDWTFEVESPAAVRATIAHVVLGARLPEPTLGSITLKPHQESSIERLESALDEFAGALLCDDVGMGKTFVALAIARRFQHRLIVAPAALEAMWRDALSRTGMSARFITYEQLSRSDPSEPAPELLILDEAHHARNPAAKRYARIAQLARNARVLLLTATPIHNRRADLVALLSIFLGSRANDLSERELSRCVVRRDSESTHVPGIPEVLPVMAYDVPDDSDVVAGLMGLPPPVPPRDGGSGGALINLGLVHQWASSEAALMDSVRRRIGRATALVASLQAGRYPTAGELAAWTFADGALQLGFAELLAAPTPDGAALLDSVASHASALEGFRARYRRTSHIDEGRARILAEIRNENPGAKIVAFAQYAATVSEMFRRLARGGGVAMLTASGAQVAGGKLSRQDAIERFAPHANRAPRPSHAEAIDLLLATDLLSEGVNLQDAQSIVHLDVPWTAARMEQRVGRVARMGSSYPRVRVYQLRPPASAESVLHAEALVSTKWQVARRTVGANGPGPFSGRDDIDSSTSSIPARTERLRAILERWAFHRPAAGVSDRNPIVAAVAAGEAGFIAAGYMRNQPLLLTCRAGQLTLDLEAQIVACGRAEGAPAAAETTGYNAARLAILQWTESVNASESAGADATRPARRKHLLNRIDSALQNVPPHLRASRARLATAARRIAAAPHGAAVEADLDLLASSPLSDDQWLLALSALDPAPNLAQSGEEASFHLRALLLLQP